VVVACRGKLYSGPASRPLFCSGKRPHHVNGPAGHGQKTLLDQSAKRVRIVYGWNSFDLRCTRLKPLFLLYARNTYRTNVMNIHRIRSHQPH
jgi:hypothetical protein